MSIDEPSSDNPADSNPYRAPELSPQAALPPPNEIKDDPYPTYCSIYFPIDLIFGFVRAVLILLALRVVLAPNADLGSMAPTVWAELTTNLGMVALGIPADFLMLTRKRIGAYLAFAKLVPTLGSFGVGIWQASIALAPLEGSPAATVGMVSATFMVLLRLALVGVYVGAILTFLAWTKRQSTNALASSVPAAFT